MVVRVVGREITTNCLTIDIRPSSLFFLLSLHGTTSIFVTVMMLRVVLVNRLIVAWLDNYFYPPIPAIRASRGAQKSCMDESR